MILEFKTRRNTNGHKKYLRVDTESKEYSTFCRTYITDDIEVKSTDMNLLMDQLKTEIIITI